MYLRFRYLSFPQGVTLQDLKEYLYRQPRASYLLQTAAHVCASQLVSREKIYLCCTPHWQYKTILQPYSFESSSVYICIYVEACLLYCSQYWQNCRSVERA